MNRWVLIFASFLLFAGCATTMPVPPGVVDLKDESAARAKAESAWGRVLSTFVNTRGRVDITKLAKNRKDLDAYVAWIAKCGPNSHPRLFADPESKLAHLINSYNALVIYGFLAVGDSLQDLKDPEIRTKLFEKSKFIIGKDDMTLADYRSTFIQPLEEPRANFALHCLALGCPKLWNRVYQQDQLKNQLEQAAREFLNDERIVQVDAEQKKVFLSELLNIHQKDFVNERYDNTVLEYVNRYRDPRIPSKYAVEYLPIDWEFPRPGQAD